MLQEFEYGDLFAILSAAGLIFGKGLTGIAGASETKIPVILQEWHSYTSTGEAHRRQRRALSPVFSIAHMRDMRESKPLSIYQELKHETSSNILRRCKQGKSTFISCRSLNSSTKLEDGLNHKFESAETQEVQQFYPYRLVFILMTVYTRLKCFHGCLELPLN